MKLNTKMEEWKRTAIILCLFGLFKEFRPSESFVTEYLLDFKGLSLDSIVHTVFPVATYTYLGTLAIVFLITDILRYRSVVVLEGLAYVGTWCFLIWGRSLTAIIVVEVLYGIAASTEVAYFTYMYAKVDKKHYKKVTSYTYSALLAGRLLGGASGQIFVSYEILDYHGLHYVSLGCVSVAFMLSFLLPKVKESIYFYRPVEGQETPVKLGFLKRVKAAYPVLWKDFKEAYSNTYVLKWSIWWSIATAGHLQAISYVQPLWETVASYEHVEIYNGAVDAIQGVLSALLAFGVGYVSLPWFKWGETFLVAISLIQGAVLVWMSRTTNLDVAYACYIIFRTCFQLTITVASAEVAQGIREDSYGLIFGINTFLALGIQTVLTVVLADQAGLALDEQTQFLVLGISYGVLGVAFAFVAIYTFLKYGCAGNTTHKQHPKYEDQQTIAGAPTI